MISYVGIMNLFVVGLFAFAAWLAIWSRRDTIGRHAAVAVFIVGVPIAAAVSVETLGWAKPLWAAYELRGDFRVIGAKIIVDDVIFAYIDIPSSSEPRAIRIPYSSETASKLQSMMDNPGTAGEIMMRFDWSQDQSSVEFHLPPPENAMPEKEQQEEPLRFERPD